MSEPVLPDVFLGPDATVVVTVSPDQAEVLARVLYAYDALSTSVAATYCGAQVVDGYDTDTWNPVALALLGEAATIRVPFMTGPAPGLRLVEGGGR